MTDFNIKLSGYDILGTDVSEGIRYAWRYATYPYCVESAAFIQRSKAIKDNISGYTTSVSCGCILNSMNLACKFCRTGTQLPYGNRLTAVDIAKQNIFMVLSDMNCSDHIDLMTNAREFAYMGQGEPGFSYPQVSEAIQLTDIAMKELGQTVFRHIIATSGVPEMIEQYVDDLRRGIFSSRTTMHFSLHSTVKRNDIMPINSLFPYKKSLEALSDVARISGEKPCIGILLLNNFATPHASTTYTTDLDTVKGILQELDRTQVRLSFCEFNGSPDLGTFDLYENEKSQEILNYAREQGFEAKLFSSFGQSEATACGMLGGKKPQKFPSQKWTELEQQTEDIILSAKRLLKI